MDFVQKETYTMEDLLAVMERLRAPDGCPWDREQTHESIRQCFLEETYEALEAIDNKDVELLEEELGDVLFQVVFHAQLEKEKGTFSFEDVTDGVVRKMILRHPHVFGNTEVSGTADVLKNWDAIKKETKGQNTQKEVLESVSKALPALMRSAKVLKKAEKAGFKREGSEVYQDLSDSVVAAQDLASGKNTEAEKVIGRLLLAVVNVSNLLDVDPEEALTRSCDDFIEEFGILERDAGRK